MDRYDVDKGLSFVLSVPYDTGTRRDGYVTATRAIFGFKNLITRGNRGGGVLQSAPIAVAGVQFKHENMAARFFDIASKV